MPASTTHPDATDKAHATDEPELHDVTFRIYLGDTVRVHATVGPGESDTMRVLASTFEKFAEQLAPQMIALERAGNLRTLPRRADLVSDALGRMAFRIVAPAIDRTVTPKELRSRLQVAEDAVDVVFDGDSYELDALIDTLTPVPRDGEDRRAVETAEARARLRLEALYRRVIRDSYPVKELKELRLSRQRLQQLRADDRLFAIEVPHHKGLLHPRWQFEDVGRPRPEMPDLIAAAREGGLDALAFHLLMLNPDAADDGPPVDLLGSGRVEEVLEILRAGGQ